MPYLPRIGGRQSLDPAVAEGLLAGRGCCPEAPAGPQALAHVLDVASSPREEELAGEAAAVAAFLLVTSPVARWRADGNEPGCAAAGAQPRVSDQEPGDQVPKARAIGEGKGGPEDPPGRAPEGPPWPQGRPLTSRRGADFRCPPPLKSASRLPQARHWRYSVGLGPVMSCPDGQA